MLGFDAKGTGGGLAARDDGKQRGRHYVNARAKGMFHVVLSLRIFKLIKLLLTAEEEEEGGGMPLVILLLSCVL